VTNDVARRQVRLTWALYALFVLYGCTIPFRFAGGAEQAADKFRHVSLSPWIDPQTGRRPSIPDTVQNILLFVPFGALGLLAGRRRGLPRVLLVTGLGATLSVVVETTQLFTTDRVTSVNDLATNTFGTLAGATAAVAVRSATARAFTRLQRAGWTAVPEFQPLAVLSTLAVVTFWQPFDVTLDVGTVFGKVKALLADPLQFTGLRDEGLTFLVSALLSMSVAAYLKAIGRLRPALGGFLTGVAACACLESSQLLITSRMPALWDLGVGVAGSAAGVMFWTVRIGRGAGILRWSVLALLTSGAAACLMLSPFQFSSAYHSFGWFPFYGYYARTTFEALSHVIEQLALYFPLGFLAAHPGQPPRAMATSAALVTLAIAGPIEYLQGWVDGRYPDVTDVAIALLGTALGVWVARSKTPTSRPTIGRHSADKIGR
jgi:glycopeptide antibiotics resistance protein